MFAIQKHFTYGWDYTGIDKDGYRALYHDSQQAQEEINRQVRLFDSDPELWRVVEYNEAEDDMDDVNPRPTKSSKIKHFIKYMTIMGLADLLIYILCGDK